MATQTMRQQATEVRGEKTEYFFSTVANVLETYGQRRLSYLKEQYGEEWWKNRPYI